MNNYILPVPDRVSVGLDYVRVSYSADSIASGLVDRYVRSRADVMGVAMYGDRGTQVLLARSSYGSGYRAGRHYSIMVRHDGARITEIASGVGARYWLPPRYMADASWRRIDVAIDYVYAADSAKPSPVDQVSLADGIINRADEILRVTQQQRSVTTVYSDSTTVYIGSRQSERMLRIYNKSYDLRRQQADEPDAIVRVELELKARGCNIADVDLLASGDLSAYLWAVVAYMIRTYRLPPIDCPVVPPVYNPRLDESDERRTLRWIQSKVIPAMKRLAIAGYGEDLRKLGVELLLTGQALETDDVDNRDGED